jgi:trimeric autotransporter adhesin
MSTKTTFKRIALVAVASLGFGLLSAAPSSAATFTVNQPVALTTTPFLASTTVGTAATNVITWSITTNDGVTGDKVAFTASVAVKPTGSVATPTLTMGTSSATARYTLAQTSASVVTATIGATPAPITANALGTLSFTPDVPGEYQIAVTPRGNLVTGGELADSTGVAYFSVYASGLGFSVAASGVGSSSVTAVAGGLVRADFTPATIAGASVEGTRYVVTTTAGAPITSASGTIYTLPSASAGTARAAGAITSGAAPGIIAPFNGSTADYSAGASFTDGSTLTPHTYSAVISTPTAGTYTVTVTRITAATGVPAVLATGTITVGASAPTAAAALSTAFIGAGTAFPVAEATAGALRFPSTANATVHATIGVTLNDANGVAINNQSISATITGAGLITATAGNGTGAQGTSRAVSITAADQTTNQFRIGISADGTRGVGTITVLRGTTVIATKTVTFYGSVATLTATQTASIMRSGRTAASTVSDFVLGGSNAAELATAAITRATATNIAIVAKDVDGNVVPGVTVTADISDVAVISDVTITSCANGAALTVCASGAGNWIASTTPAIGGVSGAKATVTFKTPNPLVPGAFISTAALPFSLGGTALGGTVTMTLNKATYEPGERVIITYTAKDAAGNPVRDWTTAATPSANKNLPGLAGGTFVGGTVVIGDEAGELVYAPVSPGDFIITLATGTATGAEITAKATVADDAATAAASAAGDAAAEATDAANAATDAANAAAEAADAATAAAQDAADAVAALSASVATMVSDLKKQITSLTNLVIKIQRKVKA